MWPAGSFVILTQLLLGSTSGSAVSLMDAGLLALEARATIRPPGVGPAVLVAGREDTHGDHIQCHIAGTVEDARLVCVAIGSVRHFVAWCRCDVVVGNAVRYVR
jgi:hypothetical protein